MSYAFSAGLQAGVYQRLIGDPALAALVGGAIYDAPLEPALGGRRPTTSRSARRRCGRTTPRPASGAIHDFTVTVHSGRDGFDGGQADRRRRSATA